MREQHTFTKEQPDSQPVPLGSQSSGEKPKAPTSSALQRIGNYDLVRRIGIGGMGEVYLARQRTAFGREVAVKIIRSDLIHDITIRKRFLREAEVNAYLQHNHILPIIEFNEENGRLFLVTPYIKDGTLSRRLRDGRLSFVETHEIFTALVQAVAYLHKNGVIHRDLKPSNILLQHEEGSERVYVRLIDFGIASLPGQPATAPLTTAGHEMGTEAYMAPERLSGIAALSNDIYSLGIILYQMLTGKLPEDEVDTMLPEPFEEVVLQCTASDPSKRYVSAEELLKAFEHAHRSLSSSHLRVSGSNPNHPPVGRNSSARLPSVTPQRQASSALPAVTPMSNEYPVRSPVGPQANGQVGGAYNVARTSNVAPIANSFNSTNVQNTPRSISQSGIGGDGIQMRLADENFVQSRLYPSQSPNPVRLRSEVVLPPLTDKRSVFKSEDYDAPTSYLSPKQLEKSSTTSASVSDAELGEKVVPRPKPKQKKRGAPAATIVSAIIIIIVFVIGGLVYSIYQSFDGATVTVTPRLQTVSTTLNLTAKLNQISVDSNAGIIPAGVIQSTKSDSKTGNTTGQGGNCTITPLPFSIQCQQAVSQEDVNNLTGQLVSSVQSQIEQDIRQQEQAQGATGVGSINYPRKTQTGAVNPNATATPPVGTVSNTVTVMLTMEGSQEYIKKADVLTVATPKLKTQLKQNYTLIDSTVKTGQSVLQSLDAQGNARISIAVGAVSSYTMTPKDISSLQKLIAGKSQQQARAILAGNPNLDPNNLNITVNYGGDLPGDGQKITINEKNPSTMPAVQLPAGP
jgi:serine/threonine protein kinase